MNNEDDYEKAITYETFLRDANGIEWFFCGCSTCLGWYKVWGDTEEGEEPAEPVTMLPCTTYKHK